MKRFLRVAVPVFIIAVIAAGVYLKMAPRADAATASATLRTAPVQRGTLMVTVSGAGNITPAQQVTLNFQQSGVVSKVNVGAGSAVKAGDVLASLDTSNLELQVQVAQANLKQAQDKLAQAKAPSNQDDIANAQAALQAAQANYNKLVAGASAADIAAAKAAVTSAQAAYQAAVKSAGTQDSQLAAAKATMDKAQAAVQQAQAAYDKVASRPNIGELSQSLTLQQDTIDFQNAQANYQTLLATAGSDANSKVQQAKASLTQAQANLTKLQKQVTQDDITAAQAQVTEAKNSLDKLTQGPDANTVAISQDAVDQAELALKEAQLTLQQAQILAPFDGVVTAVNIAAGQNSPSASTGAIELADLKNLQIVTNLSETDISRVREGQTVQISLDALPNATLTGKVLSISPVGVQQQGVVSYPVTIQLTNRPQIVKAGMTTNLGIVVAQRDNVLMVPNRAVKTTGSGAAGGQGFRNFGGNAGSGAGGAQGGGASSAQSSSAQAGAAGGDQGAAAGANGNGGFRRNQGNFAGGQGGNGNGQGSGQNGGRGAGTGNGGQRFSRPGTVTVLANGQQKQVPVQIGLQSDTMTEIVSGLNEGDVVVLNGTAPTNTTGNRGFGFPGFGRFGG